MTTTQDRAAEIVQRAYDQINIEFSKPADSEREGTFRMYLRMGIEDALTAAREESRREGWEEACHYIEVHRGQVGLAELMRSLPVKEKADTA